MYRDTIRVLAGGDLGSHPLAGDIDGEHLAGQFAGDVGTAAICEKDDAAGPFADGDIAALPALGDVDHIHLLRFFGADVKPAAIWTEYCMLRVAPLDLDALQHLSARGIDQHDTVVVLDSRRQQLAIGRQTEAFRRVAETGSAQDFAGLDIDAQQAAILGIGEVQQRPVADHATRATANRKVGATLIGGDIDDADRRRFFVGNVGERRGQHRAGEQCEDERQPCFHAQAAW